MKQASSSLLFCGVALLSLLSACSEPPTPLNDCENVLILYSDQDGDGFGNPTNPIKECTLRDGFVENNGDLDDTQSGVTTVSNIDKILAFLTAHSTGDTSDILTYFHANDFTQYNPMIADGREGIANYILDLPTGINITPHRIFNQGDNGDLFILHSTYGGSWNGGTPQVAFDIFEFDNGSIINHWDNFTDLEDDGDGTTQTNGVREGRDIELEISNNSIVREMVTDVLVSGIDSTYNLYFADLDEYVQHGVNADPDSSRIQELLELVPEGQGIYDSLAFCHVFDDFALVAGEGPDWIGGTGELIAYYDLFFFVDELVRAHWEVHQIIPSTGMLNNNGKWGSGK